ncbi:MAG: hypothetical protein M0006_15385 [Magnetospirillum sp.]|nr:hypothetical protein [Magnetospirillum sp.]
MPNSNIRIAGILEKLKEEIRERRKNGDFDGDVIIEDIGGGTITIECSDVGTALQIKLTYA